MSTADFKNAVKCEALCNAIMAEGNGEGNESHTYYRNNSSVKQHDIENTNEDSDSESVPQPDIGLRTSGQLHHGRRSYDIPGLTGSSSDSVPRNSDNPFSFTHFLNRDSTSISGGARPKVYSSSASVSSPPPMPPASSRLMSNPELTSGLPDFVQDHLVIEQCYLNTQSSQQLSSVDLDNFPDFAPGLPNNSWSAPNRTSDIPFDLTSTRRDHTSESSPVLPLDLPERLPFDLPSGSNEVGSSKSLPDFLSDGPILSGRRTETSQPSESSSPVVPSSENSPRLQLENERLRRELESVRRQLADQIRRSETLEAELTMLRNREHEDSSSLEKVIEQVEDNLRRTTKRAVTAENKVTKLKQEIKMLTNEMNDLQTGRRGTGDSDQVSDVQLANQLRSALGNAEISLRQLLSGVDAVRVIASTLENRHRIEEQSPDFLDPESQDESGPAL